MAIPRLKAESKLSSTIDTLSEFGTSALLHANRLDRLLSPLPHHGVGHSYVRGVQPKGSVSERAGWMPCVRCPRKQCRIRLPRSTTSGIIQCRCAATQRTKRSSKLGRQTTGVSARPSGGGKGGSFLEVSLPLSKS
jgi:hypothetical protein